MTIGCSIGAVIVIIIIAIILVSTIFGGRNNMVKKEILVEESLAQVQNVYQRRLDLVPNLAESATAYMQLEKDIFEAIADARASIQSAETPGDMESANQKINSFIRDLKVVVENTPELKASGVVKDLMSQLEGTENRIAVERKRFNESVRDYNTYIKLFPNYIIAGWFDFTEKDFFEAEEGAEIAPEVDLELD
jgi:LemA protein